MANQPAYVLCPSMAAGFQAHSEATLQSARLWWKIVARHLMAWPVLALVPAILLDLPNPMTTAVLMPATTAPLVKGPPCLVVGQAMQMSMPAFLRRMLELAIHLVM